MYSVLLVDGKQLNVFLFLSFSNPKSTLTVVHLCLMVFVLYVYHIRQSVPIILVILMVSSILYFDILNLLYIWHYLIFFFFISYISFSNFLSYSGDFDLHF